MPDLMHDALEMGLTWHKLHSTDEVEWINCPEESCGVTRDYALSVDKILQSGDEQEIARIEISVRKHQRLLQFESDVP